MIANATDAATPTATTAKMATRRRADVIEVNMLVRYLQVVSRARRLQRT